MSSTECGAKKVVLITGASRGIGEVTARRLAKDGYCVVLAARSAKEMIKIAEEIRQDGGEATYVVCDAAKEEDLKNAVDFAAVTYGRLDVVFSNAGWEGSCMNDFHATPSDEIVKLFNVNLMASFYLLLHKCKWHK
jgi:NAD(P)-dependent dehydrogenase (short-subunit alcohol dehydrogenase family)